MTQHPQQLFLDLETNLQFQKTVNTSYTFIYFFMMNIALGLYFIQVLPLVPQLYQVIILAVYIFWMLFALLFLAKKNAIKEQTKTQRMIDYVKTIKQSFEK